MLKFLAGFIVTAQLCEQAATRTRRARPAMILADSIRQTALIVRWVADTDIATHHSIPITSCNTSRNGLEVISSSVFPLT